MSDLEELIVYATPTGALAKQCDTYFDHLTGRGWLTTAQTYPPHVTLTGFFWRSTSTRLAVVESIDAVIRDSGPIESADVAVKTIAHHDGWVGLEIESKRLTDLVAQIVAADVRTADEDAIRPKDWFHLSLAYGELMGGADLGDLANLAKVLIDPKAEAGWEIAVWQRQPNGQTVHGARWRRVVPSEPISS